MVNLRCPVCAGALEKRAGAYLCPKNHSFDIAKSGLFIIAIFLVNRPVVYIPCLLYILILYKVARIPWSYALKGLKGLRFCCFLRLFSGVLSRMEEKFLLSGFLQ